MRIVSLTAENVKKIKVVHIEPSGAMVQITGANGSGKSSVLDAIWWALKGKAVIQSQPVRQGEESAVIRLDLGALIVTRRFDADGATSLKVESAEGALFPSPQRLLDGFLGSLTFDPLAFMTMERKPQLDQLRKLVKLDVDVDLLDGQNRSDFEKRADVNRRVKALEGKVATYAAGLIDGDVSPIDTSALLRDMEQASKTNQMIEQEKRRRIDEAGRLTRGREEIEKHRAEAARLHALADKLEAEINATAATLAALPALGEPTDVSKVRESIEEADRENTRRNLQRTQRANYEAAAIELRTAKDESEEISVRMEHRTKSKTAAIASAKMPVDGLSFGDGMVVYKNLPLDQASSAEQLRVSLRIGMAMNPTIRVILMKQGPLLDETSLALVAKWAEEENYQVWVERVDTTGSVGIIMEDGRARLAGVDPGEVVE